MYLLDTHARVWGITLPEELSARMRDILAAGEVVASVVSYWPDGTIPGILRANGYVVCPPDIEMWLRSGLDRRTPAHTTVPPRFVR